MNILLQIDKSSNKANNICNLENETFQGKSEIGDILFSNDDILGEKIIYIGREVYIENDKIIDLLAVDEQGRILVFELSTEVAPRNIIAQVLEYISYIRSMPKGTITDIALEHFKKYNSPYRSITHACEEIFNTKVNNRIGHEIVPILLAKDFSEEIISLSRYLYGNGMPVRCIKYELYNGSDNNNYFLLQDVAWEAKVHSTSNDQEDATSEEKEYLRKIMLNLSKKLEDSFGEWSSNLSIENIHEFDLYQSGDGAWTSSFTEWKIYDVKLCLEISIYPEEGDQHEGLCIWLHTSKYSENLIKIFQDTKIQEFLKDNNFENESEDNILVYTKYFDIDITYENVESLSVEWVNKLKPIIEIIAVLS